LRPTKKPPPSGASILLVPIYPFSLHTNKKALWVEGFKTKEAQKRRLNGLLNLFFIPINLAIFASPLKTS
jgi:hypothetical protein